MGRTKDQEADHRYDPALRRALMEEFYRRTGHMVTIERDDSGLYTIKIGNPALPETHEGWTWLKMNAAKKARAAGQSDILPHEESNSNYALIELLGRLMALEAFIGANPELPISL